jgi:hypothetical protein
MPKIVYYHLAIIQVVFNALKHTFQRGRHPFISMTPYFYRAVKVNVMFVLASASKSKYVLSEF